MTLESFLKEIDDMMRRNSTRIGGLMLAAVALLVAVSMVAPVYAQTTLQRAFGWAATGKLLLSDTAPTIASGFGTSPSIASSNGAAVFRVNVGTGGSATSGVVTMPTASNGWGCVVQDQTTAQPTRQTATSTTSVTVTASSAWTASDILVFVCAAY